MAAHPNRVGGCLARLLEGPWVGTHSRLTATGRSRRSSIVIWIQSVESCAIRERTVPHRSRLRIVTIPESSAPGGVWSSDGWSTGSVAKARLKEAQPQSFPEDQRSVEAWPAKSVPLRSLGMGGTIKARLGSAQRTPVRQTLPVPFGPFF